MSQQQKYAKQKQECEDNIKSKDENVKDTTVVAKDDSDGETPAENVVNIKIHRKRSIHQTAQVHLADSSKSFQETNLNNGDALEETEEENSVVEKRYGQGSSLSDLLEMGADGEISSSERGKGQIARKLTFGHEIIDQYHKGANILIAFD